MERSEKHIRAAWQELFPESTGADESFFELGGSSLQAAIFIADLRQQGIDVPLAAIFEVGTLGAILEGAEQAANAAD